MANIRIFLLQIQPNEWLSFPHLLPLGLGRAHLLLPVVWILLISFKRRVERQHEVVLKEALLTASLLISCYSRVDCVVCPSVDHCGPQGSSISLVCTLLLWASSPPSSLTSTAFGSSPSLSGDSVLRWKLHLFSSLQGVNFLKAEVI